MIARTVHNHTPENQLDKQVFAICSRKKKVKKMKVFDIDKLPTYF